MFGVVIRVLRNEDGFTASEYGLMAALTVIFVEGLLTTF
jgi:Flp pilus assembly pilin Flp